jgi:hypothetical protein
MESLVDLACPPVQSQIIDECFSRLRDEVSSLVSNESQLQETINKLSTDLSAFKTAYSSTEKDKRELEEKLLKLKQDSDREINDLENQLRGSRVVCLIDGDGAIFSRELVNKGHAGGLLAAKKLSEGTADFLTSKCGLSQFQLWVYVFLNKKGLVETFERMRPNFYKQNFDDFVLGFNQSADRFLLVDVGGGKEAADAKIKAHLEDNIRLPQTCKILFGGCHDNGYVTTLRSQITAGFKDKIILLASYNEMAAGIEELDLPLMMIPDLFIAEKIVVNANSFSIGKKGPPSAIGIFSPSRSPTYPPGLGIKASTPVRSAPVSYSSALQSTQCRAPTPELDGSSSPISSDAPSISISTPRSSPAVKRVKIITPGIPVARHVPPPCTLFYLAACKHGDECKYGHDYVLNEENREEIRRNAKNAPCPTISRGESCVWGERCCYGHTCPNTTKCHFLKQGRCKFASYMHH